MIRSLFAATLAWLFLAACGPTVDEPEQAGFLTDYSKLEEIDDNHLFWSAGKTGNYDKFILDPVKILFDPEQAEDHFTAEDLNELKAHFDNAIREELTRDDGYEIVTQPGPGVARLRAGITQVEETVGALNVLIYTKVTGAGIGGAAAEGELVDSVTGEQLAASVRWGGGSRVLRAGFTKMGDAKLAIDRWAKDLREKIDLAQGRGS